MSWWISRIREDESVLWWWMQKFGTILDLDWIYCNLDPPNKYLGQLKMGMRAWISGKPMLGAIPRIAANNWRNLSLFQAMQNLK